MHMLCACMIISSLRIHTTRLLCTYDRLMRKRFHDEDRNSKDSQNHGKSESENTKTRETRNTYDIILLPMTHSRTSPRAIIKLSSVQTPPPVVKPRAFQGLHSRRYRRSVLLPRMWWMMSDEQWKTMTLIYYSTTVLQYYYYHTIPYHTCTTSIHSS